MGIDAQVLVKTKTGLSKDEIKKLSYRLGEAFGHKKFSIIRPDNDFGWEPRHCLETVQEFVQDGPSIFPAEGEQLIEVHLWTRYYGFGYERGDLPLIFSIADWLQRNIPDAEIWYGGDSSGVLAKLLTESEKEKLWNHFCQVGHLPHSTCFDRHEFNPPDCALCQMRPIQSGSGRGGKWGCFYCPGCGWEIETADGGKSFHKRKEEEKP